MVIQSLKYKRPFILSNIELQKPSLQFSYPISHLSPTSRVIQFKYLRYWVKITSKLSLNPIKPSHIYLENLRIIWLYPMVGQGVYQIPYSCGKLYIGQTRGSFKSHLKEGIGDTLHNHISTSAIFEHSFNSNYLIWFY